MTDTAKRWVTNAAFEDFAAGIGADIGTKQRLLEALINRGDLSLLQELQLLEHRVAALEAGHRAAPDGLTRAQQEVLKAKLRAALGQGLNELAQQQGDKGGSAGTLPPLQGEAHGDVRPPAEGRT